MLSTKEEPETDIVLPEQAERILEILRTTEQEWMSRTDIAKVLGKNTLNPGEMAYLEVMKLNGLVNEKQAPIRTPTGFQWVYQAVEVEDSD